MKTKSTLGVLSLVLVMVFPMSAFGQSAAGADGTVSSITIVNGPVGGDTNSFQPLPRDFRGLSLGMPLDDLKAALIKDDLFSFRGDRDVSFLPVREQTLVETTGLSYIKRAYFQLADGAVFIMSFSLDTKIMDHYSVFTTFVNKYGPPASLSPGEAVWETDDTRVSIERPLTVKYIDKKVFNRLIDESKALENRELLRREEFLENF
ncbi:MAG: hypothetical protein FWF26_00625 [Treponema sp.]|nr:hypothetical protein [Treponema sp.]